MDSSLLPSWSSLVIVALSALLFVAVILSVTAGLCYALFLRHTKRILDTVLMGEFKKIHGSPKRLRDQELKHARAEALKHHWCGRLMGRMYPLERSQEELQRRNAIRILHNCVELVEPHHRS